MISIRNIRKDPHSNDFLFDVYDVENKTLKINYKIHFTKHKELIIVSNRDLKGRVQTLPERTYLQIVRRAVLEHLDRLI